MAKDNKPSKPEAKFLDFRLSDKDKKFIADRLDGLGVKIQQQESTIATLADTVDRLAQVIESSKPFKIEVTCKCQGEGDGGGLTAEQEAAAAAELAAGRGPLQESVDANQPVEPPADAPVA